MRKPPKQKANNKVSRRRPSESAEEHRPLMNRMNTDRLARGTVSAMRSHPGARVLLAGIVTHTLEEVTVISLDSFGATS
jgi:hypothetical protein